MKKLVALLTSLSLVFSSQAFALTYTETQPEAVQSLVDHGPGAIYAFLRPDGAIERNRVVQLTPSADGKSVVVTMERADSKLIVNFSDENHFSVEPISNEAPDSEQTADADQSFEKTNAQDANSTSDAQAKGGTDWGVGVSAGILAGLQVGIIEATGFGAEIEEAYRHIDELRQKIGEDFERVERARFDLEKKTVAVSLKATHIKPQSKLIEVSLGHLNRASIREYADQSQTSANKINFISKDTRFLEKARAVQATLVKAKIKDSIDQTFFDVSKGALVIADQQSFLGREDAAETAIMIAKTAADVLVGLDPFTGFARSLYESVTGTNMVTAERLSPVERAISIAGVLTAGYALKSYAGFKIVQKLSLKLAPMTQKSLEFAERLFFPARKVLKSKAIETVERSVNTLSDLNKKWGFTQRHLDKHFLGDSKFSLKVIDPGGNAEAWLGHISSLFQRPVTKSLENGAVDIMGQFARTDGKGTYDLGVRLWPNKDGTFELVTILTRQSK